MPPGLFVYARPPSRDRVAPVRRVSRQSGRLDSNQRPYGPEPYALAKLSYAPFQQRYPIGPAVAVNSNSPTPAAGSAGPPPHRSAAIRYPIPRPAPPPRGGAPVFPKMFDLTGKAALVTGGSKGLGKAMARGLAEAGADVVISSRHEDELRAALDEV